jgi:tRNA(Ile2) C34 agmatinyltransferase TiaS
MDRFVKDTLTRRLDEIDITIKALNQEYRAIANYLIKGGKEVELYTCPACGESKPISEIEGYICKACYNKENQEKKVKAKKVAKVPSIDEVQKKAEKKHLSYGQLVAQETMRNLRKER